MKRTMAVLTAILCLVMMFTFSVPFSADETTVTATAPVPITIGAARAEYGATGRSQLLLPNWQQSMRRRSLLRLQNLKLPQIRACLSDWLL